MNIDSFRILGVGKVLVNNEWRKYVIEIKGYVSKVVREFYANLSEHMDILGKLTYKNVYVCGHIYAYSPKVICNYLKIPLFDFDEFEKEYGMNEVATELLGIEFKWPKKNTLKVLDLTLNYAGLHKIP